jgi:hypothetical protein
MSPRRHGRRAAVVAACAVAGTLAQYAPAQASPPDRHVVLALRSPAAKARVTQYLRAHGFHVTPSDRWTVAADGPATAALETILGNDVSDVAGLGTQHAWRHHSIPAGHTPASLRSAYDVVRAGSDGTGLTIATVQFSGWDSGDLTTYAAAAGLTDPNPAEIAVGGANPADTSSGGDFEVALDQEVLLAAAPKAAQRIYFGKNTSADAVLVYSAIANDAEAGLVDVVSTSWGMCERFADQDASSRSAIETQLARIVAAGATVFAASGDLGGYDCSSEDAPDNTAAVDFPAASPNVVAVGGTRLAGTTGAWTETAWSETRGGGGFLGYGGGGGESTSVAKPSWQAGLPGTHRLVPDVAAMAAPDNGFGLYAASQGGWVLGGGTSAAAPLVAGHLAATLSSGGRSTGVGDIHPLLYANPTAFRDITQGNNLLQVASTGYDMATGLGSPRWSALGAVLFGDPLVTTAAATGSPTVTLNVTPVAGMTVTGWTVGEGTTVPCATNSDPVPTAFTFGAGSDRATHVAVGVRDGVGACHVGTAPVLVDTRAPSATAAVRTVTGASAVTDFSWGATDAAPSSGIASYDVCVYALGTGCAWTASATTARSARLALAQGRTYVLRVQARDRAGNLGPLAQSASYVVPLDSYAFAKTPSWKAFPASADWFGSHVYSTQRGAYAQKSLTGTKYELYYVAFPGGGYVDVYIGGYLARRVNTYSATKQYRKLVLGAAYTTRKARTVKVVVRGTKDRRSSGTGVAFDAVRVTY